MDLHSEGLLRLEFSQNRSKVFASLRNFIKRNGRGRDSHYGLLCVPIYGHDSLCATFHQHLQSRLRSCISTRVEIADHHALKAPPRVESSARPIADHVNAHLTYWAACFSESTPHKDTSVSYTHLTLPTKA